ncbi:ribonuclease H-like domain-containing protein [Xylaria intraflava]|nr:ribonuclease H-like domain-containing protein [Xylaria intraflava]
MAGINHRENGVRKPRFQRWLDQNDHEDLESTFSTPNAHFAPHYWHKNGEAETSLQKVSDHGYLWASPALSEPIYSMLTFELLDYARLKSEGYPLMPPLFKFGRVLKMSDSRVIKPLPPADPDNAHHKYAALVIDCEMVELADRVSDLVRISVVDFMTGNIVLDSLVQPVGVVKQWRTRVSGVDAAMLRAAKADPNTTVLQGWPAAREKIFTLADENTIFIGHALSNDLKILRITTERVVDSLMLTAQAAFGRSIKRFPRMWSLKSACKGLMNIDVQKRRSAHDPREDALAARELVLWCLTHPTGLLDWGYDERTAFEQEAVIRYAKRLEEARQKAEEATLEEKGAVTEDVITTGFLESGSPYIISAASSESPLAIGPRPRRKD